MSREGVGFLIYAVLDAIIDSYAPSISGIEDEVGEIELAMLTRADNAGVMSLLRLRRDIAALRPVNLEELAQIKGVGASKLERYGQRVLGVLATGVPEGLTKR